MSERYSKLFSLQEHLYITGSPVMIEAGALLKDTQTNKVVAQLKLRNVGAKKIKAVTVAFCLKDVKEQTIGAPYVHSYLDVHADRNEQFGTKQPVVLPDKSARAYDVYVTEVVMEDGEVWLADKVRWESLEMPETLEDALKDEQLVKQYRINHGGDSKYVPTAQKDIWFCSCGRINQKDEDVCHGCGNRLLAVNTEQLTKDRDERLVQEQQIAKKKKKKAVLFSVAAAVVAVVMVVALMIANAAKEAAAKAAEKDALLMESYNEGIWFLKTEQYSAAQKVFEKLGDYKDSETKLKEAEDGVKKIEEEKELAAEKERICEAAVEQFKIEFLTNNNIEAAMAQLEIAEKNAQTDMQEVHVHNMMVGFFGRQYFEGTHFIAPQCYEPLTGWLPASIKEPYYTLTMDDYAAYFYSGETNQYNISMEGYEECLNMYYASKTLEINAKQVVVWYDDLGNAMYKSGSGFYIFPAETDVQTVLSSGNFVG